MDAAGAFFVELGRELELAKYRSPEAIGADPRDRPHNILGTHRVTFTGEDIEDIEDTVARLRPHGAELLGGIARFEDSYLLCYVRGPEGIIVGLAEQLGRAGGTETPHQVCSGRQLSVPFDRVRPHRGSSCATPATSTPRPPSPP